MNNNISLGYKRKHTKLVTYFDKTKEPQIGDITTGKILGQKGKVRKIYIRCGICHKPFWSRLDKDGLPHATNCQHCMVSREGSANPNWKGGRNKDNYGYINVRLLKDDFFRTMADAQGELREHRLVMAKHLNRCLLPWEIVHHRNGIKDDNRIENLQLINGSHNHVIDAVTKAYIKKLERRIYELEGNIGMYKYELGIKE